jgi:hypothetical protein
MTALLVELLRHPADVVERCRRPELRASVARTALVVVAVGGAIFGAALGSYRGGAQVPLAALKIPLATLATLAVCGPGFAAFAAAFGRRWSLPETLSLALAAGARSSLVLFALAPALWLTIDLHAGYHAVRLAAAGAYAVAGLSGLFLLLRGLGEARGRGGAALAFVALFLVVGAQTAWLLRPYLGDPRDAEVPLFAQGRREGGVLGALGESSLPPRLEPSR